MVLRESKRKLRTHIGVPHFEHNPRSCSQICLLCPVDIDPGGCVGTRGMACSSWRPRPRQAVRAWGVRMSLERPFLSQGFTENVQVAANSIHPVRRDQPLPWTEHAILRSALVVWRVPHPKHKSTPERIQCLDFRFAQHVSIRGILKWILRQRPCRTKSRNWDSRNAVLPQITMRTVPRRTQCDWPRPMQCRLDPTPCQCYGDTSWGG